MRVAFYEQSPSTTCHDPMAEYNKRMKEWLRYNPNCSYSRFSKASQKIRKDITMEGLKNGE